MMPALQNTPVPLRKVAVQRPRKADSPFDLSDLLGLAGMFAASIFVLNLLSDPASDMSLGVLGTLLNGLYADDAEGVPGE